MTCVRLIPTIAMIATAASACGDGNRTAANAGTPEVPHDVLTIEHVIGGANETAPEYEFGRISGLALLDDGRIAVADYLNDIVRVFNTDGTHAFSFGRDGAGPREFSGPCCIAVDSRRRLWVRDGGNARYSIFALHPDSAEHVGQVRMAHGDVNRWVPTTFDSDGNVIDIGSRMDPAAPLTYRTHLDSAGRITRQEAVHKVPDDSTSVRTVERAMPDGVSILFAQQPQGPRELAAYSPTGEFAHALSSRYVIDWRAPDGSLIRTVTRDVSEGPALSAREDSVAGEWLSTQARHLGVTVGQLGFGVPVRKTPLRTLFFDSYGGLWVELQIPDGSDRRADVYDVGGLLERTVAWPANVTLTDGVIRGESVWGVGRDSLRVATVVRMRGIGTRN